MRTAMRQLEDRLIDRLPAVRGRYTEDAPLAGITWFRVGGPAEVMFRPADVEDLAAFLAARPADVPVTVIGVGSNLLVRDGGIPGVVVRLGRGFAAVTADVGADGRGRVRAGAAALDVTVAAVARDAGLTGLEFLSGIPGTLGGAVRMNAGAYGGEIKDVLVTAAVVDGRGRVLSRPAADLGLAYRHTALPEDWIVTGAILQGRAGDLAAIDARMAAIRSQRETSQPVRARTGGSTFRNPSPSPLAGITGAGATGTDLPPVTRAWELIDRAGCRGLSRGGAMMSDKHCNFLLNTGTATAADIEDLGEEVRRRVFEATGVELEWEIRRIGVRGQGDRS